MSRHVIALDGLRAIAVGAVVANHTGSRAFRGGYLGVDVFFVLSGFLITTLLLREREAAGTVRLRDFYARRALRLYPALLLTTGLAAVLVAAGVVAGDDFGLHVFHALAYLQDLAINFGWLHEFGPLAHTWSLAIEEHFYLLWPPTLLALYRWRGRSAVAAGAWMGAAAGWVVMLLAFHASASPTSSVYYRPDARSAALLLGCAIATRPVAVPNWASAGAAMLLLAGLAVAPEANTLSVFAVWMPLVWIATATLISGAGSDGPVFRFLAWRPLVQVGVVSYGLYLLHPFGFALMEHETNLGRVPAVTIGAALSLAVSFASYYAIEIRLLKLKRRFPGAAFTTEPQPERLGEPVTDQQQRR